MARNVKRIARLLGAQVVGQIEEPGGGAFGAARLGKIVATLQSRLHPGEGKRPGRPTVAAWDRSPKVPMSRKTQAKLTRLAQRASEQGHRVSPMQLAAQLLEDALECL